MKIIDNHSTLSISTSRISGVGVCDMGCLRKNNEDNFVLQHIWTDNFLLAIAIDGVGGQEGGEVAAAIAAESIPKFLETYSNGDPLELLCQAVQQANNDIFDQRKQNPKLEYMSCVLTATIVDSLRSKVYMAHVGDTRLYRYNGGVLQKLSHDHSLVGYREEVGDLTEEEAMHHPQRNIISRDVGSEYQDNIDFVEAASFDLYGKNILMLCSDGLCDMITSAQIQSILEEKTTLKERCNNMVEAAKQAGGRDNITVLLIEHVSPNKRPVEVVKNDVNPQPIVDESNIVTLDDLNGSSSSSVSEGLDSPKKGKSGRIFLLLLFTAVLAVAIGFFAGRMMPRPAASSDVSVKNDSSTNHRQTTQQPYVSDKISVEDFHTASILQCGSMTAMSLSQVSELCEATCYKSIKNSISDSVNTMPISSHFEYLNFISQGQQVWCECELTKKDSNHLSFSSVVYSDAGIMARGEHVFEIMSNQ